MKDSENIEFLVGLETKRQKKIINLIASENYVSKSILKIIGSNLTNKYAEGYPDKRYYQGCQIVDQIEKIAIKYCKKIFNAEHANVQPHSGSQANYAVYEAILNPKDKVLAMDLASGGHITHGSKISSYASKYKWYHYHVNESGWLDYQSIEKIAKLIRPKLIIAGASAYPRAIDFRKFKEIAKKVDAYLMVDMAHIAGLIAAGLHQNPCLYADIVTSTTHKTLRGARGGIILCKKKFAKEIDRAVFPGIQGGPLLNNIAGKAQAFKEIINNEFQNYQKQVIKNTKAMVKIFLENKVKIITGGSDNHLFIINVKESFQITGKEAAVKLEKCNVICNANLIFNDPEGPFKTSGIRLGTPAMTTFGFKEKEFIKTAKIIIKILKNKNNDLTLFKKKIATIIDECIKNRKIF